MFPLDHPKYVLLILFNALSNHLSEEIKEERWNRFMTKAQEISEKKLSKKVGTVQDVIVDELDEEGAICRTRGDAPVILNPLV